MDREQTKQYIREQLTTELDKLGISYKQPFRCLSPSHSDTNPSMSYDKKRNKVHCFSCLADYDTFDVIGIQYGLTTFEDQYKKAMDLYQLQATEIPQAKKIERPKTRTAEEIAKVIEIAASHIHSTDYFQSRGLSQETISKYKLGYVPQLHEVIIPIGPHYFIKRSTSSKQYTNLPNMPIPIFNADYLSTAGENDIVYITESALDAMSIEDIGGMAIGLNGVSQSTKLIQLIQDNRPKCSFILSLDNDEAGRKATEELSIAFRASRLPYMAINTAGPYKDPNEALIANRDDFTAAITNGMEQLWLQIEDEKQNAIRAYRETSVAHHVDVFKNGIRYAADTPAIPTGFKKLDKYLDGGLYEGLYIIGAISSLGKTTYVMQMADQIAQQQQDVLIFSLEQSRYEIMAKSISRLTFIRSATRDTAKTVRGILNGKLYERYSEAEKGLITAATEAYRDYAKYLFISEGVGDIGPTHIREATERHISITGNKPVIVIDYLQILAPYDVRATDKQNTDKAVLELKRISRDYKLPIVAISSFNRTSYQQQVSMESFKESGAIEYSSDVLIGLQAEGAGTKEFDIDAAKSKELRDIELKILKNRNGKTGTVIKHQYSPMFNYFTER